MRSILYSAAAAAVFAVGASAFMPSNFHRTIAAPSTNARQDTKQYFFGGGSKKYVAPDERTYPESKPATYDLLPDEFGFGFRPEIFVRPLLKQTQIENRKLKVTYNAKKDGWDALAFHRCVDGKGASVVLAKVKGRWIGGYNPRGWASLAGSRPSVAAFLFYGKTFGGWQKLRVQRSGGMACGRDEYDTGIYFGADALVIPLSKPRTRSVTSRLGYFYETGPEERTTLLPVKGQDATVDELYVISGVYANGEDIPNSGGVTDLGFY